MGAAFAGSKLEMKLLFAIKTLSYASGGAERVLADVSSGLSNNGHDISILVFDKPSEVPFYPLNKNIRLFAVGMGEVKCQTTLWEFIKKIFIIRKIIKQDRPDCVIAFMHSTFIPAAFGMIGTNIPLIASEHTVPDHYASRKKEYFLFLISRFFIDRITVVSKAIIESYSPILQARMCAMPNPVLPAEIIANTTGDATINKIILNVGRLEEKKDQGTLIKAFALIAHEYPDWSIRIIGEGKLRLYIEGLIAELNMQKRICLPGATIKINTEYSASHIFALPSIYESFGLATAEAMAHGLPTLGFESCPGTNELIVNNSNGLLIKESGNRVLAFAHGLKLLMENPKLRKRLGDQGINTVKQYELEFIVKNWEELISNVIER